MESVKISGAKRIFRWDSKNLNLLSIDNSSGEEKLIVCDKCGNNKFVVEGALKRCVECNSLYL